MRSSPVRWLVRAAAALTVLAAVLVAVASPLTGSTLRWWEAVR